MGTEDNIGAVLADLGKPLEATLARAQSAAGKEALKRIFQGSAQSRRRTPCRPPNSRSLAWIFHE
jgi:hypothetical protein